MKVRRTHYVGAVAVAAAANVGLYLHEESSTTVGSGSVATAGGSPIAANPSAALPDRAALPRSTATHDATASTLSTRYDQLAGSGNPTSALAAYNLAMDCVWATQQFHQIELQAPGERSEESKAALTDGSLAARASEACGDLTDAQVQSRLKYVEAAAAAGVPLAALRLSAEGLFGDQTALANRPDDPAILEWRERVSALIKLAADKGDLASMASLSNMYESGTGILGQRDPYKALEYATAKWELQRQLTGRAPPFQDELTAKLAAALTPEQARSAREAGYGIAAAANSGAVK